MAYQCYVGEAPLCTFRYVRTYVALQSNNTKLYSQGISSKLIQYFYF